MVAISNDVVVLENDRMQSDEIDDTLCIDYHFNNSRPVPDDASDEQITPKMEWQEQKKWILINAISNF